MDALKIGQIINEPQERDAVHMAVVPVTATVDLKPGEHIGVLGGRSADVPVKIGIVDPFLRRTVKAGERFWLFLYPGSIRSLRHHWTHPAFPEDLPVVAPSMEAVRIAAARRMRDFAVEVAKSYEDLIYAARMYLKSGECLCEGDRYDGQSIYNEFWSDFEILTGEVAPEDQRGSFFSCWC